MNPLPLVAVPNDKQAIRANLISFSEDGHREAYDRLLVSALVEYGIVLKKNNDHATVDFFAMLDDNVFSFVASVAKNIFLGRRTVGLFFRSGECFKTGAKYRLKRLIFQFLKYAPRTVVLTILPFWIEPRFEQIADGWIYDPQLWDLDYLSTLPGDSHQEMVETISATANGRKIIIALGAQNRIKGFAEFANIWLSSETLRSQFLFVGAGKVSDECIPSADVFAKTGGVLFDFVISDHQLLALYEVSDAVWTCYAPDYDQSSGIFGRAFQKGKPALVRAGSRIATLASGLGHPILGLPFDEPDTAAEMITSWRPTAVEQETISRKIKNIRNADLKTLSSAFGLRSDAIDKYNKDREGLCD